MAQDLAGLEDAAGRGRKASISAEVKKEILSEAVKPPKHRKRWSCRSMAKAMKVSKNTVQRLWSKNKIKPHLTRVFKISTDPNFAAKFWDVIGLSACISR